MISIVNDQACRGPSPRRQSSANVQTHLHAASFGSDNCVPAATLLRRLKPELEGCCASLNIHDSRWPTGQVKQGTSLGNQASRAEPVLTWPSAPWRPLQTRSHWRCVVMGHSTSLPVHSCLLQVKHLFSSVFLLAGSSAHWGPSWHLLAAALRHLSSEMRSISRPAMREARRTGPWLSCGVCRSLSSPTDWRTACPALATMTASC